MITQSDDAIASAFYASVGGDGLVNWMKSRYHVPDLGYPPSRAGWWGNTHLRPSGLVKLYAKLKRDRTVAPWLLNAMHHARPYGSDGQYQFFGIPSATKGFAVKQGWGNDYEIGSSADFNTTGFINNYRYAVAILARGPSYTYGSQISALLTQVARRLLPGGYYPDPSPHMTSIYPNTGGSAGGTRVTVRGSNFTHVTRVMFGDRAGRNLQVVSPSKLFVTSPPHARSNTYLRVLTTHGDTSRVKTSRYTFDWPPSVKNMSSPAGRAAGGATILVNGGAYSHVHQVLFGTTPAASVTRMSRWQLKVVAPKHVAGTVNVRVVSLYGRSVVTPGDRYTYIAAPTITAISPDHGPAAGENMVTITGTAFRPGTTVTIGGHQATAVTRAKTTTLTATVPAGQAGVVDVVVTTPFGTVTAPHGYTYEP
jgi:hypothetical protein